MPPREGAGDEKGSPTLSDLVKQDWRTAGEQAPLSYEEGPRHIIPRHSGGAALTPFRFPAPDECCRFGQSKPRRGARSSR